MAKNPTELEKEYIKTSDKAIDLFSKGQRLTPEEQARYDQVKSQMSANSPKQLSEQIAPRKKLIHGDIPEYQNINDYAKSLGKKTIELTDDEYRTYIKPHIKKSYDEYKTQGLDHKAIRDELKDAYGYEDMIDEIIHEGVPRRSDIQVWRDRATKYANDMKDMFPWATNLTQLNDDDIQEMIDMFGFDRKGEW